MPPELPSPGRAGTTTPEDLLLAAAAPDGAGLRAAKGTPGYKGRIFGRSVLDVRFRAYYGEDLFLGELLVGVDPERRRRYLFRITDVAYGSEPSDDGWAERTAGGLMSMEEAAPAQDDLAFLRAQMGDVEIGRLRSGEDAIDLPVGIRGETLPSHVGVFATTGMGKSNLMKVLAGQLLLAHGRYALLLFDPHGEYLHGGGPVRKGLAHHPWAAERLRVYSLSAKAGQASLLRLSLAELTVDDLRTAWKFSGPQSEALESAYALLGEAGTWLKRLAEEEPEDLKDAELGRHALATIQVLCRRARRIVRLPLMTEDPSQSLTGKVLADLADGKVVLVDTSGMEAVEETLVASLLTRSLLTERAEAYRADRDRFALLPRTLVALEEAQRVLTRLDDAEFNVFPRLAREGRKFNVGLCAVTQQPKLIDPELLSQFNTYFVLGLADERDRSILRSSSKQDLSDLGPEIQTLMPGEALVTNPEAPFALPTKVHYYEDWLHGVPEPEAARPRPAGALDGFYD